MADFLISSLRGGLNEDAPVSIADDQCTTATNVEWFRSRLGERRKGSTAIDVSTAGLSGYNRVTWLYRHMPTTDPADAEIWMLAIKDSPWTAKWVYKNSSGWHTVSPDDALTQGYEYQVQGQTLHGKLFIAYKSAADRLHVWDGTALRRTGLAEPAAAPTASDTGVGSFSGTRYYRTRETVQSSGATILRSEPTDVLTKSPSGAGTGLVVTKPTTINTNATHWELEASVDNANFYVIATTAIGSSTATDSQDYTAGYAQSFTLSEDSGDYDLIPSVRYLTAEQDRLMGAGSFESNALDSRVIWTPVNGDPGVGNDERIPLRTDNFKDLDNYEGGRITGLSATVNGYVFAGKMTHLYQLARSGVRTQAYEAICLTKNRGVIDGSMVTALDSTGNPSLFALDPDIGPIRFGPRGVEPCGYDLIETWDTVNLDATQVKSCACYFPEKKQVHWWIPTGSSNAPDTRIVLHTQEMRQAPDGMRRGWAIWDGPSAGAIAVCLAPTNIDSMGSGASNVLAPLIGIVGTTLAWLTDEGNDDNGTAYAGEIVSKPFMHGNVMHQFESQYGALVAKAQSGAVLDVSVIADFGLNSTTVEDVSLTPAGSETRVMKFFDNLGLSEMHAIQVSFADTETPGSQWSLDQFGLLEVQGQS